VEQSRAKQSEKHARTNESDKSTEAQLQVTLLVYTRLNLARREFRPESVFELGRGEEAEEFKDGVEVISGGKR
jgi:hypothetical protein